MFRTYVVLCTLLGVALINTGCMRGDTSFSVLSELDQFQQAGTQLNTKLDVLWVIDNSGSMDSSQQNVADNFTSFIDRFQSKGFDFRLAVTTTEAYRAITLGETAKARFRQGAPNTPFITPTTPDLTLTFMSAIVAGINGSGDERAFQSFKAALDSTDNAGFLREDSFLAIVIVSDEDDFSWNGPGGLGQNYNSPSLHTTQSYVDYLDTLTSSTEARRRYAVHSISIPDAPCRDHLNTNTAFGGRLIGQRYQEIATATGGITGDLCGGLIGRPPFETALDAISEEISLTATRYPLAKTPVLNSIVVFVNSIAIPVAGWTYVADANAIEFAPSYIPNQGDQIFVQYDPANF